MLLSGAPRWRGGHHPMGGAKSGPVRLWFNRQLRVEFHGATVTSDAGLLLARELDECFGLSTLIERHLADPRTGRNYQFPYRISFASPSTAAWPATRTRTTRSDWPRTRRFGCWHRGSGETRASRSRPRCIGSRRMSWRRSKLPRIDSPEHG